MNDEEGQRYGVGTGQGVARQKLSQLQGEALKKQLDAYMPKPQMDGEAVTVASLEEVKQQRAKAGGGGGADAAMPFEKLAAAGWRNFRRQLDRCVHYAECRLCELVTLLT